MNAVCTAATVFDHQSISTNATALKSATTPVNASLVGCTS